MGLRKRLVKARTYWRLWLFGAASIVMLLAFLDAQGFETYHSGDMKCGGDTVCEGFFGMYVPTTVTNYLGETVEIKQLCFGSTFNMILDGEVQGVDNFGMYRADNRYREDNPNRWKPFTTDWQKICLNTGWNHFKINGTKPADAVVKWGVYGGTESMTIDPLWDALAEEVELINFDGNRYYYADGSIITYTPTSVDVCRDNRCTKTAGVRFAQNASGDWVDVKDVMWISKNQDDITFHYDGFLRWDDVPYNITIDDSRWVSNSTLNGDVNDETYYLEDIYNITKYNRTPVSIVANITFEIGVMLNTGYVSMAQAVTQYGINHDVIIEDRAGMKKYSLNLTGIPPQAANKIQDVRLTYKSHEGFPIGQLKNEKGKLIVGEVMGLAFDDLLVENFGYNIDLPGQYIAMTNISDNIVGGSLLLDPSLTTAVGSDNNDDRAEYAGDTGMRSNTEQLAFGNAAIPRHNGLRFTSLGLPAGAVILNATLQFEAAATDSSSSFNGYLSVDNACDAPTFGDNAANISTRVLTTANITANDGDLGSWTINNNYNYTQDSSGAWLADVVQELVNECGAVNTIAFINIYVDGTQERIFDDQTTATIPTTLFLEYEIPIYLVQQNSAFDFTLSDSRNLSFGSSPTQNNVLVAYVTTREARTPNIAGWQAIGNATGGTFGDMHAFYKVAGAGEAITVNATWEGQGTSRSALFIAEYTGTDTINPVDLANVQTGSGTSLGVNVTDITVNKGNSMIVVFTAGGNAFETAEPTWTDDFIQRAVQGSSGATNAVWGVWAERFVPDSGTYQSNVSWSTTTSNSHYVAFSMPLGTVTQCGTLSLTGQAYELGSNITASGTCLTIEANNISLDMKGYNISYRTGGGGVGINVNGYNNFSLYGGGEIIGTSTIDSSSDAITLTNSNDSSVQNIVTRQNSRAQGIQTSNAHRGYFRNNTIYHLGGVGSSFQIDDSPYTTILNNTINQDTSIGITFLRSNYSVSKYNIVTELNNVETMTLIDTSWYVYVEGDTFLNSMTSNGEAFKLTNAHYNNLTKLNASRGTHFNNGAVALVLQSNSSYNIISDSIFDPQQRANDAVVFNSGAANNLITNSTLRVTGSSTFEKRAISMRGITFTNNITNSTLSTSGSSDDNHIEWQNNANGTLYLTNVRWSNSSDFSVSSSARVHGQWYVDFTVTDGVTGISGVSVNVSNVTGASVFTNALTDANGRLNRSVLTEFQSNLGGTSTYLNYTVNWSDGTNSNTTTINFSDNRAYTLILSEGGAPPAAIVIANSTWVYPADGATITKANDTLNYTAVNGTQHASGNFYLYMNSTFNRTSTTNETFNLSNGFYVWNVSYYNTSHWSPNATVSFTVSVAVDTCTCTAGSNWTISNGDICTLTSTCDLTGYNFTIIDSTSRLYIQSGVTLSANVCKGILGSFVNGTAPGAKLICSKKT